MKCSTNFISMSGFVSSNDKGEIECPVCGKMFKAADEHSYKIGKNRNKLVCTYSCMRKWEKGEVKKPKRTPKKTTSRTPTTRQYNPREGKAVRIVETGEVFPSAYACGKHLDTYGSNIRYALKTGNGFNGYHFERVKEGENNG